MSIPATPRIGGGARLTCLTWPGLTCRLGQAWGLTCLTWPVPGVAEDRPDFPRLHTGGGRCAERDLETCWPSCRSEEELARQRAERVRERAAAEAEAERREAAAAAAQRGLREGGVAAVLPQVGWTSPLEFDHMSNLLMPSNFTDIR